MKILCISDIHLRREMFSNKLQKIYNPDLTIFLGDYFDNWPETHKQTEKTAIELAWSLQQPNRIHLIGNHDAFYASGGKYAFECSGFTHQKLEIINDYISQKMWQEQFKLVHIIDNIIFSHAGLSEAIWFCPFVKDIKKYIYDKEELAMKSLLTGEEVPQLYASYLRGDYRRKLGHAGCTWMDWKEFSLVEDYIQIVGHSKGTDVKLNMKNKNTFNFCLDTKNNHVLTIDTDKKEFLVHDNHEYLKNPRNKSLKDCVTGRNIFSL